MPYDAQITRENPTCLLFLIDQSTSMAQPFGRQPDKRKADGVAEILNDLLYNLTTYCAKNEGIYEYLHVGIIGYGEQVASAFQGGLAGQALVSVGELANKPLRVQERKSIARDPFGRDVVAVTRWPVWIEPSAQGHTPLAEALTMARQTAAGFIARYPKCFPPLVLNLTDGKPSTDPRPAAMALSRLASQDGRVLLFNLHLSDENKPPIEFPARLDQLTDKFARFLFRISSVLPPKCVRQARDARLVVEDRSRGFVFNADFASVHKFLDFGTKSQQVNSKPLK